MIKRFSDWHRVNEVKELTDENIWGKYFENIVSAYRKYPDAKPSRDVNNYPNAKGMPQLAEFMYSKGSGTSAEILESVIDEWYKWPSQSKTRSILINYVNNDDDLSNLTLGTVVGSSMGDILTGIGGLKALAKTFFKGSTKGAGKAATKAALKAESSHLKYNKSQEINEGVMAVIATEALLWALGTAINYTLYGSEEVYDDPILFWAAPYLPAFKGIAGDNPLKATYVTAFNFGMALIYDAWNLSMGQEKYGNISNPILSWQNERNYITDFFNEFYDDDMKSGFSSFMNSLKAACLSDSKNPEIFKDSPFYYTAEKMRVIFEDGRIEDVGFADWQKWVRSNYQNYYFYPIAPTEFNAKKRQGGFRPLGILGVNDQVPGDPFREITVKWNDGSVGKYTLLQFEMWLLTSGKANNYSIAKQDILGGGSTIELAWKESPENSTLSNPPEDKPIVKTSPLVKSNSTFDEIAIDLQADTIDSFTGMGDV